MEDKQSTTYKFEVEHKNTVHASKLVCIISFHKVLQKSSERWNYTYNQMLYFHSSIAKSLKFHKRNSIATQISAFHLHFF